MKIAERNRAIELRRQGRTFGEILHELAVSKGSLSYWLRDIVLTPEQLARIKYKNDQTKGKFIQFNKLRKDEAEENKKAVFTQAAKQIRALSREELKLVGIALYWAEGHKGACWKTVSFTNSDPGMIRLIMRWFREVCGTLDTKFRIRVQCHSLDKINECERYWSKITGIPLDNFTKAYIKVSPSSKRKVGNLCRYGICSIRISDNSLLVKIKGWINGLSGAIV